MIFAPGYDNAKVWLFQAAPALGMYPLDTGSYLVATYLFWRIEPDIHRGEVWIRAPYNSAFAPFCEELERHPEITLKETLPTATAWVFDKPEMLDQAIGVLKTWMQQHREFI